MTRWSWRSGDGGKSDALLHHSNQGRQNTSEQFQRLMTDHGVTCPMSRPGNVWAELAKVPAMRSVVGKPAEGNAAMEGFFSSLKTERIAQKTCRTRNRARAYMFDYIERSYNPTRSHSTLGYLSPMDFEKQANVA